MHAPFASIFPSKLSSRHLPSTSRAASAIDEFLEIIVGEEPKILYRDYNASRNILIGGMEQPVAPIEPKPLHHISVMQVLAMKWEAAPFKTR